MEYTSSNGKTFTCDEADYENYFKDKTIYIRNNNYAFCNNTPIHRIIMNVVDNKELVVDHINRDPLDNTRENLRTCTVAQNNCNKGT